MSDMPQVTEALGEIIRLDLPNGTVFCTAWVDARLDKDYLRIVIAEDGKSVLQKMKAPQPQTASDLLAMYDWGNDKRNMVVKALNAKLLKMKKQVNPMNERRTSVLLALDEEVLRYFVDIDGNKTNRVEYVTDHDGRQRISFFLKTVGSHEEVPQAATFVGGATRRNGMDCDDFDEETVEDEVRAEMDQKLKLLADHLQTQNQAMQKEVSNNVQHMMKDFMEQFQYQFQVNAAATQHEHRPSPVPDNASSYNASLY
jgi:hypothetical protein